MDTMTMHVITLFPLAGNVAGSLHKRLVNVRCHCVHQLGSPGVFPDQSTGANVTL